MLTLELVSPPSVPLQHQPDLSGTSAESVLEIGGNEREGNSECLLIPHQQSFVEYSTFLGNFSVRKKNV